MKRIFSLFLSFVLLLGCLSGLCFADTAAASVTTDGKTAEYTTLEQAVAALSPTGKSTLTLLKDCETSGKAALTSEYSFTLDLNGHTLKSADKNGLVVNGTGSENAVTTVKNGVVWAGGQVGLRIGEGALTMENTTVYGQIGVGLYTNDPKHNKDNLIKNCTVVSYVWATFVFNNQTNIQSGIEMTVENSRLIATLNTSVLAARGTGNTVHIGKNVSIYSYNPSGMNSKVTLAGESLEKLPETADVEIAELGQKYAGLTAWGTPTPPLGFADGDTIDKKYFSAVEAMTALGAMTAFDDGTFRPQQVLTRAQAAELIYRTLTRGVTVPIGTSRYNDVPPTHPAAGCIEFCLRLLPREACGDAEFQPDAPATGAFLAEMFLTAAGYTGTADAKTAAEALGLTYNCHLEDTPITREQACQTAWNFKVYRESRVVGLRKGTVSFAWGKNVKLLGRAEAEDSGVRTNYPGDGVEFTVICGGDFIAHFDKKQTGYYRLTVDGEVWDYNVLVGSEKTMADMLPVGEHTIRIVQEGDTSTTGRTNIIEGITLLHKPGSVQATEAKDLYIEFIGDSITAGMGTMGNTTTAWSTTTHSATHSYAYMTADLLDADYALIAKGGIGAYMVSGSSNGTILAKELYACQNVYFSPKFPAVHGKADIVVINIGTNDKTQTPDTAFETKYKELVLYVREHNPDAKIVMIAGMMNTRHLMYFPTLAQELGGADAGYYFLQMERLINGVPAGSGNTPHPSADDNRINAAKLAEFLRGIL